MKVVISALALVTALGSFVQAAETSSTVGSSAVAPTAATAKAEMTVEGPIVKVVARKNEIYVKGPDKKHEFYFKPETVLVKDGQPVEFSTLKEGMKVRVTYVKAGRHSKPLKVEILQ